MLTLTVTYSTPLAGALELLISKLYLRQACHGSRKTRSVVFFVSPQVLRYKYWVADQEVTGSEDSGLSAYFSALLRAVVSQFLCPLDFFNILYAEALPFLERMPRFFEVS